MRRLLLILLFALVGYALAAVASYLLVGVLSSNPHDRSVEAAMAAAFVYSPAGAVLGLLAGLVLGRRHRGAG